MLWSLISVLQTNGLLPTIEITRELRNAKNFMFIFNITTSENLIYFNIKQSNIMAKEGGVVVISYLAFLFF